MADLARRRALSQLLDRPDLDPAAVTRHLLAVQAQDLVCARRAIRARSAAAHAGDVDRALADERGVVITWLNRGTLHLVDRADYPWLHGLTAQRTIPGCRRRLAQMGVDETLTDRGVDVIVRALEHGPLTRDELATHLDAAGVPTAGQALIHLVAVRALRGLTVRGPVTSRSRQAIVLTRDWLGTDPPQPLTGEARDRALAELARRYLRGHGPATDRDLATWAGLALGEARRGLAAIAGELDDEGDGLVALRDRRRGGRLAPRLLPMWDPALVGWQRRDHVIAPGTSVPGAGGGAIPAVAIDKGRAVATWTARRDGSHLHVRLDPFAPLPERLDRALARDAADLERFEAE